MKSTATTNTGKGAAEAGGDRDGRQGGRREGGQDNNKRCAPLTDSSQRVQQESRARGVTLEEGGWIEKGGEAMDRREGGGKWKQQRE